jgi:hypothetical protein
MLLPEYPPIYPYENHPTDAEVMGWLVLIILLFSNPPMASSNNDLLQRNLTFLYGVYDMKLGF